MACKIGLSFVIIKMVYVTRQRSGMVYTKRHHDRVVRYNLIGRASVIIYLINHSVFIDRQLHVQTEMIVTKH